MESDLLTLVIPVYKNEGSISDLLRLITIMKLQLSMDLEVIFVIDGSPDRCYELLAAALKKQSFKSKLILLSRNFGSFMAIRTGLAHGTGSYFAVMAADLQEPPELVIEISKILFCEPIDVVIGVRQGRIDPLITRISSRLFWGFYRRFVVKDIPSGGVDMFGCNREFRDSLLKLDESHSSLIAQIYWLGYRRKCITYQRKERVHGKSAWTLKKKINYLLDSIFSFTDLPVRILAWAGGIGATLSTLIGIIVAIAKIRDIIHVPGYTMIMLMVTFLGFTNLLGLGIVGSYAWRTYENTKHRPLAIPMRIESYGADNE